MNRQIETQEGTLIFETLEGTLIFSKGGKKMKTENDDKEIRLMLTHKNDIVQNREKKINGLNGLSNYFY